MVLHKYVYWNTLGFMGKYVTLEHKPSDYGVGITGTDT